MSQITSLLNGENINQDWQLTAPQKSLINPGIIEGLKVENNTVSSGEAFVLCNRGNGEKIMVHFTNTENLTISTSGTKKVFIEIHQSNIDDGSQNNTDGTGIGEIKTASSYPAKNFLPLASISNGTITNERKTVKKL